MQYAVGIARIDLFRIHILWQRDHAPKGSAETLPAVVLRALRHFDIPLPRYGEQVLLNGDIQCLRIESGGEEIDIDAIACGPNVDGG